MPILRDIVNVLVYLHAHYIIHYDIKPANIMEINNNRYVFADYGEGFNLSYKK